MKHLHSTSKHTGERSRFARLPGFEFRISNFGFRIFLCLVGATLCAQEAPEVTPASSSVEDPYKGRYASYIPDFIRKIEGGDAWNRPFRGWKRDEEEMKLSTEPKFFTLNVLDEDSRANALVEAGLKKEAEGQYREALKIYQQVIDNYPRIMYRVSEYGVFVPVSQYCQRRILRFPIDDLRFYRSLYDAQARETFEQARRAYSLAGLSDIVERMLATSYGGKAILELGNAALDAGHFLAALEHFAAIRDDFPDRDLQTPELALKIAYCQKMLGQEPAPAGAQTVSPRFARDPSKERTALAAEQLDQLDRTVAGVRFEKPPFVSQHTSDPHVAADDYTLLPPTADPLALEPPVWQHTLPGTRDEFHVYTHPVVTGNSVIYRHHNIIFCRSLLNGELRWTYDVGGRARWQNWAERQYPQEDVLVQDGLVFTPVKKSGPSLVAIDETTGQIRWAYGPLVAATEDEARMRFETAPAGGPNTVYAGYVLDNIEGETHTDSEYGLFAFESATGRVQWRVPVCRLAPGKFSGGLAESRRNRIRSFISPPVYHEGTVYYNTNAGAIIAVDALSGRTKWLMRYPYYPGVHDATRQFGEGGEIVQYSRVYFTPHRPMFWYNQRPLVSGRRLYFTPVDTNLLLCLDRTTGRVEWSAVKESYYSAYLLGMTPDDQLVVAYTGRDKQIGAQQTTSPIHLLNSETGETVWKSPDLVVHEEQPSLKNYTFGSVPMNFQANGAWSEMTARPTLTRDGRVYVTSFRYVGYPIFGYFANLAVLDLNTREIVSQRRYLSGEILARLDSNIHITGPEELQAFEDKVSKSDEDKRRIELLKEVVADTVPENEHGPFFPFSRVTFDRYGTRFELRIDSRSIGMVYDRAAVRRTLLAAQPTQAGGSIAGEPEASSDPRTFFALAELAIASSRLDEAARLLETCLEQISSEDLDFRAAINQQLYGVHQGLARRAIRSGKRDDELAQCLGMSRTASTLAQEIETLFAVADACERQQNFPAAAKALQTIVATYGHHEYPVAPIAVSDASRILAAARKVMDSYREFAGGTFFGDEFSRSISLTEVGLPLYFSSVSPLPKTLTVRAGELASMRLMKLQTASTDYARTFQAEAAAALNGKSTEELLARLSQFPTTPAAQRTLEKLIADSAQLPDPAGRQQRWLLADSARISGLKLPPAIATAPEQAQPLDESIALPQTPRNFDFADEEGAERLVLDRRGQNEIAPHLLFLGARIRKRLDNKFVLTAMDLRSGETAWETEELRLKGKGQEAGFFEAFVSGELVVVHGLYDVLAFQLADGKPRWHFHVPFDFEIQHAELSRDLLFLAGKTETLCLYVPSDSPLGEVVWQVSELGDQYAPLVVHGERVLSVRKLPFSVTVRSRSTGRLIGRLDLPDLSQYDVHPLIENGPAELPIAFAGKYLAVSDGWYYILIDTDQIGVIPASGIAADRQAPILWKRLIDNNDVTREPALRFSLSADYFTVLKDDYDVDAFYLLSTQTGDILWKSDPKDSKAPLPLYSTFIAGETLFGLQPHPGQGYYVVARECATGKQLFRQEVTGYQAKPEAKLLPKRIGRHLAVFVADRQDFEIRAFDGMSGEPVHTIQAKGVGPFGIHGRMSAAIQQGRPVLLSKDKLQF